MSRIYHIAQLGVEPTTRSYLWIFIVIGKVHYIYIKNFDFKFELLGDQVFKSIIFIYPVVLSCLKKKLQNFNWYTFYFRVELVVKGRLRKIQSGQVLGVKVFQVQLYPQLVTHQVFRHHLLRRNLLHCHLLAP